MYLKPGPSSVRLAFLMAVNGRRGASAPDTADLLQEIAENRKKE
jgi:hypothetical protein